MSSVEEVTAAVRQVAAHEVRIAMLTERIDEMRDHLDKAGLHPQAAGSWTSLTCSHCSGDVPDKHEITRGLRGTCSLC